MENSALLTCHCGAVEINLTLPNVDLKNLEVIKGKNKLKKYTFHTHTSKHWFCSVCGIHTHHHARNTPTQYVVNLACLEGIKVEDYADAPWFNGREHPKDESTEH